METFNQKLYTLKAANTLEAQSIGKQVLRHLLHTQRLQEYKQEETDRGLRVTAKSPGRPRITYTVLYQTTG